MAGNFGIAGLLAFAGQLLIRLGRLAVQKAAVGAAQPVEDGLAQLIVAEVKPVVGQFAHNLARQQLIESLHQGHLFQSAGLAQHLQPELAPQGSGQAGQLARRRAELVNAALHDRQHFFRNRFHRFGRRRRIRLQVPKANHLNNKQRVAFRFPENMGSFIQAQPFRRSLGCELQAFVFIQRV